MQEIPVNSEYNFDSVLSETANEISFDPAVLESYGEVSDDLAYQLVEIFSENSLERIINLKTAFENADYLVAKREAHTFKGSGAGVGAKRLVRLAKLVEENINNSERAAELIKMLEAELSDVTRTMNKMFGQKKA